MLRYVRYRRVGCIILVFCGALYVIVMCLFGCRKLSGTALVKTVTTLQSVSVNKDVVTMAIAVMVLSTIIIAFLIFFVVTLYIVYIR